MTDLLVGVALVMMSYGLAASLLLAPASVYPPLCSSLLQYITRELLHAVKSDSFRLSRKSACLVVAVFGTCLMTCLSENFVKRLVMLADVEIIN